MLVTLLLMGFLAVGDAAFTNCPIPKAMEKFSTYQLKGKWYVTDWLTPFSDERNLECVETNIEQNNVWSYRFNLTGVSPYPRGPSYFKNSGNLYLDEPYQSSKLIYTWRGRVYDYTVLETDYKNWALVSACSEAEDQQAYQYVMILSKHNEMSVDKELELKHKLRTKGLYIGRMKQVDHTHCH